jgi:hypothetical protein
MSFVLHAQKQRRDRLTVAFRLKQQHTIDIAVRSPRRAF